MSNILKDTAYSRLYNLVAEYREELTDRQASTPYYTDISALDELSRQLGATLAEAPLSSTEYQRASEQYEDIAKKRRSFGHDILEAVQTLHHQVRDFGHNHTLSFSVHDSHADSVMNQLYASIDARPNPDAPFVEYERNTDDTWKYVGDVAIRSYLQEQTFYPVTPSLSDITGYSVTISHTPSLRDYIEVPTSTLVHAAGFNSWLGRGVNGSGEKRPTTQIARYLSPNERFTSINTIKNYAATPGELPPVTHVNTYIQPDGRVFSDNESGDSHRIAAAKLRGDATVKAKHLSVHVLSHNFLK